MLVKQRIVLSFSIVTALVVIAGAVGAIMLDRINTSTSKILDEKVPVQMSTLVATNELQSIISNASEYAQRYKNNDAAKREINALFADFDTELKVVTQSPFVNQKPALVSDIDALKSQLNSAVERLLAAHDEKAKYTFEFDGTYYDIKSFLYLYRIQYLQWLSGLRDSAKFRLPFSGNLNTKTSDFEKWNAVFKPEDPKLAKEMKDLGKLNTKLYKAANQVNDAEGKRKESYYQRIEARYGSKINGSLDDIAKIAVPAYEAALAKEKAALSTMRDIAATFSAAMNELTTYVDTAVVAARAKSHKETNHANIILISVTIGAILLSAVIGIAISLSITRPLQQAVEASLKMTAGNLEIQVGNKANDEMGLLLITINKLAETLKRIMGEINDVSNKVSASARVVEENSKTSLCQIDDQLDESQKIATMAEELATTSSNMEQSSQHARQLANDAVSKSNESTAFVSATMSSVNDIANELESSASVINEVGQLSGEIGSVLSVISEIAEQTNLLALNAAIEAARAGEQGRGFAVVADEVRNLATRTEQSTGEIRQTIEKLQSCINSAIGAMNQSQKNAREQASKGHETVSAIEAIAGYISSISEVNAQMVSSASETSTASKELAANVSNISHSCDTTSQSMHILDATSAEMTEHANRLTALLQNFTTGVYKVNTSDINMVKPREKKKA